MKVCQLACYYHTNNLYGRLFLKLAELDVEQEVVSGRDFQRKTPEHPLISYHSARLWGRLDSAWLPRKTRKYVSYVNDAVDVSACSLIHAHTLYSDGFTAYELSMQYRIPYVVTVRDTDVNLFARFGRHLDARVKNVLRNASRIVFVNHPYRKKLENYLKLTLPDEKYQVIPNGMGQFWIDANVRNEPSNNPECIRLICVAKITKVKNQLGLIKAVVSHNTLRNSTEPRLLLTLVGDHSTKFASKVKSAHQSGDIVFAGPQDAEGMLKLLENSDVFVLVSHKENFGVVYPEAMSVGLPIIYTRGHGMDGWSEEGEWGYSCDSRSSTELLKHIKQLGHDTRLNSEQVQRVKQMFSWETIAPKVKLIYQMSMS